MNAIGGGVLARVATGVLTAHRSGIWRDTLEGIVLSVATELSATSAILYTLHLSSGSFSADFWVGNMNGPSEFSLEGESRGNAHPWRDLMFRAVNLGVPQHAPTVAIIPVSNPENDVIYLLALEQTIPVDWVELQAILSPLNAVYIARRLGKVVRHGQAQINYHTGREAFLAQLGDLALAASGYERAALRETRGDRLDCLAAWGWGLAPDLRVLSWPVSRYPAFERATHGMICVVRDIRETKDSGLLMVPGLEDTMGFIVLPVFAGTEVFGVLSLAARVPYAPSEPEVAALQLLANLVGVSLLYYRNPSGPEPGLRALTELSARTQLEVIGASARHEGRGYIDNAMSILGRIADATSDSKRNVSVNELEATLLDIGIVLDKIRYAAKPPSYDWRTERLSNIWDRVVDQFAARLETLNIESFYTETVPLYVTCYTDWLESVFLQLILNSIDAFARKGRGLRPPPSDNRRIQLTVDRPSSKSNALVFRYSDNATGIDPSALRGRSEFEQLPFAQRLFTPGTSTKGVADAGWGLTLARAAMAEQNGSIELLENSIRGVTFQMSLPRDPKEQS